MSPPQDALRFIDHRDLSDADFFAVYKLYIEYLRHENDLLHQRTTWGMSVQAGLLLTLVYLLQKFFDINSGANSFSAANQLFFGHLIVAFWCLTCVLGYVVAISSRRSINAAIEAQKKIVLRWNENFLERAERLKFPPLMGGGSPIADRDGGLLARRLPLILVWVWIMFTLFAICGLLSLWYDIPSLMREGLMPIRAELSHLTNKSDFWIVVSKLVE